MPRPGSSRRHTAPWCLKASLRCGLAPNRENHRCTVLFDTPSSSAIRRRLQALAWLGLSCKARLISPAAFLSSWVRGRPGQSSSCSPCTPCSTNRRCHLPTVEGEVPKRLAMAELVREPLIWRFFLGFAAGVALPGCTGRFSAVRKPQMRVFGAKPPPVQPPRGRSGKFRTRFSPVIASAAGQSSGSRSPEAAQAAARSCPDPDSEPCRSRTPA